MTEKRITNPSAQCTGVVDRQMGAHVRHLLLYEFSIVRQGTNNYMGSLRVLLY